MADSILITNFNFVCQYWESPQAELDEFAAECCVDAEIIYGPTAEWRQLQLGVFAGMVKLTGSADTIGRTADHIISLIKNSEW